uniref:EGF-like domain-containing protein n=2 Tax=Timspurckia oligopyrenoides TaxID=708627 RepID=A0A7S0ZDG0_9RHOD|mmetsp:Transcript_13570/g.24328  ORF Transcript_13570/g.24328 Transcript_13570/m.24328 type:complete len:434 (+) Transcript_13570:59-1360(+)
MCKPDLGEYDRKGLLCRRWMKILLVFVIFLSLVHVGHGLKSSAKTSNVFGTLGEFQKKKWKSGHNSFARSILNAESFLQGVSSQINSVLHMFTNSNQPATQYFTKHAATQNPPANSLKFSTDSSSSNKNAKCSGYGIVLETDNGSEECICPLDRSGDRCQYPIPIQCEPRLLSPTRDCVDSLSAASDYLYDPELSGEPPCLFLSQTETQFQFKLICAQYQPTASPVPETDSTNQTQIINEQQEQLLLEQNQNLANFTYWLNTESERGALYLSKPLLGVQFVFRMFSWKRPFSNRQYEYKQNLSKAHFSGEEAVSITLVVEDEVLRGNSEFVAGGRTYMEGKVDAKSAQSRLVTKSGWSVARLVVDIDGYVEPTSNDVFPWWGALLIAVGIVLGIGCALVLWKYLTNRKLKREQLEYEAVKRLHVDAALKLKEH